MQRTFEGSDAHHILLILASPCCVGSKLAFASGGAKHEV
jgi:hypothetical protein